MGDAHDPSRTPDQAAGATPEQRLADVFESRLVAAVEQARLARESGAEAGKRPHERAGVVAPDPGLTWSPLRSPRSVATIIASILLPFALVIAVLCWLVPRLRTSMFTDPFLLALGAIAPVLAFSFWVTARARARGLAHAPPWAIALVAAYFAGLIALFLTGLLPMRYNGILAGIAVGAFAPLLMPLRKRFGDSLHCSKCDYDYTYADPASPPAPDACSECGSRWHERAGLSRGRKVRPNIWAIAAMALLWIAAAFMPLMSSRLAGLVTTGALITAVTTPSAGFTNDQWRELSRRTLSEAQRLRLAQGLLDLRQADQSLSADADTWLDAEVTAGRLPQPLVNRFHREAFEATIAAPPQVRVGVPATFDLDTLERGYPFSAREAHIAIWGWESSQDPGSLVGPETQFRHATLAGSRSAWLGVQTARPGGAQATFTFRQPGPARVTLTYWLIFLPRNTPPGPLTWNADNTLVLPAGTLFSERREIHIDLTVEP